MALYGDAAAVDVVVMGAGAAGLMCAMEAGKRGRRVVVLEHNREIGRKILISGGGRCNFTNLNTAAENFLSANRHFAKSALARYRPADFIRLVERHGIRYHEKSLGQLFCDGSAREIVAMLEAECANARVRIETGCAVDRIVRAEDLYLVESRNGAYRAASVVIATGGLSIPKIGATAFGYDIARQFGLKVAACRPALVPLTFSRSDREMYGDLAGVATEVIASADGHRFRDRMLFTHRGLSGPAILQASSYWTAGAAVNIDLLPGLDVVALFREARTAARDRPSLAGILGRHCTIGKSLPPVPKDMKRPRSRRAAWTPAKSRRRRSKPENQAAFTSSARSWMSRGSWAASIFNGLGHLDIRRGRRCRSHFLQNRIHIFAGFLDVRDAAGLIDRGLAGIVGGERLGEVATVLIDELFE
jgi:predicted Rossmann fold flavoprotein